MARFDVAGLSYIGERSFLRL